MVANSFVFSSELICLGITVFFLFLMSYSKPRHTYIYMLDFLGMVLSVVAICIEFRLGAMIDSPDKYFSHFHFKVTATLFIIVYLLILNMILMYINKLSINKRKTNGIMIWGNTIFALIFIIALFLGVWTGYFYSYDNGQVILDGFVESLMGISMVAALISMFNTFINREHFSKSIFRYIMLFIPIDFSILLIQAIFPEHMFSSVTYVLPLVLFYVVFHSNPYDDVTGFQNEFSFETRIFQSGISSKKHVIIYVTLPLFNKVDFGTLMDEDKYRLYAETCRKIEYIEKNMFAYKLGQNNFAIVCYNNDPSVREAVVRKVENILTEVCKGVDPNFYFRIVAIDQNDYITNMDMQNNIWQYLLKKMDKLSGNQVYIAKENDYEEWKKRYEIEQMLVDVHTKRNLYDERVICYVQPIYNVKEKRFKTAEALMRMQMDGKMIFPDQFIPVAEEKGCIHVLTLIMLNKVCEKIKEIEKEYDFDSISINCSSAEFSGMDIDKEILSIIEYHGVEPSKISIELTESAMFDSFDLVLENIKKLIDKGVKFYLDDFGTGYSNLERIINCPFYTIKFDKSLLYKSIDDSSMELLITEMVQIFKKKGFIALVEGVEDDEQSQFAVERGFDYIQGYKYAKPLPIDGLADYLTKK